VLDPLGALALQVLCAAACVSAVFTIGFSLFTVHAAGLFWRPDGRRDDAPAADPLTPITVLKPIKGADQGMYENLSSFLSQDHPRFQVVFCLQDPRDPALPILRRLQNEFPRTDLQIVISHNRIGFNPKVNNLSNALPHIKHDLIMISDSDVRVEPDFLRRAALPFSDPKVGLVTAFYQSRHAVGLGPALESLAVNAWFLPQAVGAVGMGMRFAMGAVMMVRRGVFEEIGGFHALSLHLADDYVLGASTQALGHRIAVLRPVVACVPDAWTIREHFEHLVRWSRTIFVCQPTGYLGSGLLHGFSLMLLAALFHPSWTMLSLLALVAGVRMLSVAWIHCRYVGNREILRHLWLLPASDLLQAAAWLGGFRSRQVVWRGQSYDICAKGRLVPSGDKPGTVPAAVL